ncbi:hypothetical protein DPMN_037741 [Dreissena polymorpha]|uniref:Uncharacterized protein n=1 Tax=Dreissena polymorpha TaxID=45954 RepID=A0A9D4MFW3_DREPO|nr:hypothetical protein DPMN_037741 [Dreissena polymorpha]
MSHNGPMLTSWMPLQRCRRAYRGTGNELQGSPLTDDEIEAVYQKPILGCQTTRFLRKMIWYNDCIRTGLPVTKETYTV